MFGYAGRILRVNLTEADLKYEPLPERLTEGFIGGAGFATSILYDEVAPEVPAFSPGNKVVFAIGPLTGTLIPGTSRYVVASKSPLTGLLGEADAGGFWPAELKFAGFDAIVVEGASDKPVLLWVHDGEAEFRDAKRLWGRDTYETEAAVKAELGPKVKVLAIGQAGERLVKSACVMNDLGHAAGRCGLGAALGWKRLKAIAVQGSAKPEVADAAKVKEIRARMMAARDKVGILREEVFYPLGEYGTGPHMETHLYVRNLPLRNWAGNDWPVESIRAISAETIRATVRTRMRTCYDCPIHCDKVVKVPAGRFAVAEGAGPEYETLAAYGSLLLNDNLESICKANDLCNRYGLDTIEAGTTIALAMECYERGLLTDRETDGLTLEWGNPDAIVALTAKMAFRDGLGEILAEGVLGAAQRISRGAEAYAMHVKGSSICEHDPRVNPPLALKYATLPMGAYHGKGCPDVPPRSTADEVIERQNASEVADSLTICGSVLTMGVDVPDFLPAVLRAVTGLEFTSEALQTVGERIFNMKRAYAAKLGISRKDDVLPSRFTEVPRVREEARLSVNLEPALTEYYSLRGWGPDGVPSREKLKQLGIRPLGLKG